MSECWLIELRMWARWWEGCGWAMDCVCVRGDIWKGVEGAMTNCWFAGATYTRQWEGVGQ